MRFAAVWGVLGTSAAAPEALPEPLPRAERPQRIVVGPRAAQGQALPSIAI